ncbi:MAG: hypothetical protein IKG76_06050 [Firmicutes bacterium]|nr:hypothetical protein [Bacillota bacterium]
MIERLADGVLQKPRSSYAPCLSMGKRRQHSLPRISPSSARQERIWASGSAVFGAPA